MTTLRQRLIARCELRRRYTAEGDRCIGLMCNGFDGCDLRDKRRCPGFRPWLRRSRPMARQLMTRGERVELRAIAAGAKRFASYKRRRWPWPVDFVQPHAKGWHCMTRPPASVAPHRLKAWRFEEMPF